MEIFKIVGFVTCVLLCLQKWEALEYYEATRKKWMPAADCFLCLGFWLSLMLVILNGQSVIDAFIAAPFIQALMLLNHGRSKTE